MNGFANFVKTLGVGRIAMLAATLAGLAAFFIFIIFRLSAPGMAPLYGKLEANDAAAVVSKLDAMRVPYQLTGDGSVVLVPEDQVLHLRMTLAENGLPSGGSAGYEPFRQAGRVQRHDLYAEPQLYARARGRACPHDPFALDH